MVRRGVKGAVVLLAPPMVGYVQLRNLRLSVEEERLIVGPLVEAEFCLPVLTGPLGYSVRKAVPLNLALSLMTMAASTLYGRAPSHWLPSASIRPRYALRYRGCAGGVGSSARA